MKNLNNIIENINNKNFEEALKLCNDYQNNKNKNVILNLKGVIHLLQDNFNLAETHFKNSLKVNSAFVDPIKNLYILYNKRKNWNEMLKCAKNLTQLDKSNPTYIYQLGFAFENKNDLDNAIENYKKCINLNGREKKNAYNNIGTIYLKKNKPNISIKFFLNAFEIDPNDKIIINNILLNYIELRDEKNSDIFYQKAEYLDNSFIEFLFNKACYLILKEKVDEAIEILNTYKNKLKFLVKLIKVYFAIGSSIEAKKLLKIHEEEINKNSNFYNFLGMRFLYEGNFEKGWKYYEYRASKSKNFTKDVKEWKGENLNEHNILVYNEQGLGDAIQFSKYLIPLLKVSKKVIFVIPKKLQDIFKKDIPNLKFIDDTEIKKENPDYKIALGSLIKFFYKEQINNHNQLIKINNNFSNEWKKKFDREKLNVGLAWSGSFFGPNEPYRSIPLISLKKIFSLNINFFCLQSEIWKRDLDFFNSLNLINFGNYDLSEISSIIPHLDLVISSDTSLLHLSASLKQETWGILNLDPDWRWGEFNTINPYSSLKLYHQKKFNNWENVESEIFENLTKKIN